MNISIRPLVRSAAAGLAVLAVAAGVWAGAPSAAQAEASTSGALEGILGSIEHEATAVEESGLAFQIPADVYFADDGWWTYLTETEALYFRTVPYVISGPEDLAVADDAWGEAYAEETGHTYLGAVEYANETVTFNVYFHYDDATSDDLYIDFNCFVPLPNGTVSALQGVFRTDDQDAMLDRVDAILASVELSDVTGAEMGVESGEVVYGDLAFTLPDIATFTRLPGEGTYVSWGFPGPEGDCMLFFESFSIEGLNIASDDDLLLAGDEFMAGVAEGAGEADGEVLEGGVFESANGLKFYFGTYISHSVDAQFGLVPVNGTMAVVSVIDTGSSEDFSLCADVIAELMMGVDKAAVPGSWGDSSADGAGLSDAIEAKDGEVTLA